MENGNGHANGHSNGHGYTNGNGQSNGNGYTTGNGHSNGHANGKTRRPAVSYAPSISGIFAVLLRRRRLMMFAFAAVFIGSVLAVLIAGSSYQAGMKVLVARERVDAVMTGEANVARLSVPTPGVSEEEMNTEVELIKSRDLLEEVVKQTGLDKSSNGVLASILPASIAEKFAPADNMRVPRAVRTLEASLKVNPIRKSNLIEVTYASHNPQLSANVLSALGNAYLQKHLAVHRPAGQTQFFEQQAEQARQSLMGAETKLAGFSKDKGVVAPLAERDIALQKTADFEQALGQTHAAAAGARARISDLEAQLAKTPERLEMTKKIGDNPVLVEQMKSKLLVLELKKIELLQKFQPDYKPVQEVDSEIAQTRAAIEDSTRTQLRENTTDRNPTFQLLTSEIAKAKADLATYDATATATGQIAHEYRGRLFALDAKGIQQQDLVRNAKTAEANYLLYLYKVEEARISDAMDQKRISNVVIAEAPVVPALPVHSPIFGILGGLMLAILASACAAFASEYMDPSFRTPAEVAETLDIPVLASMPRS
jgi:uncharacterized protein involved in exopolysaccharide biosynthesis